MWLLTRTSLELQTLSKRRSSGNLLAALAFAVMLLPATAGAALSAPQAISAATPRFDAVSIKAISLDSAVHEGGPSQAGLIDPSEWRAQQMPLVWLVDDAYNVEPQDHSLVAGLPNWAYKDLFDIAARVPPQPRGAQVALMVQAMLADRFQLKVHWEERPMQAVALTIAPGGPKLRRDPACDGQDRPLDPLPMLSGQLGMLTRPVKDPPCGTIAMSVTNGMKDIIYHGASMQLLANSLGQRDRIVVDRTQLSCAYDFDLTGRLTDSTGLTHEQVSDLRAQGEHREELQFQKQLGLKIKFSKQTKLPVRVLVVDRVEKPTAN